MPNRETPQEKLNFYIPFDFYDFFGYLFPGLVAFLYLLAFFYYAYESGFQWVTSLLPLTYHFLEGIFYFISIVIIIYVIGHAVATVSAVLFDRMIVSGIFGYPFVNLLGFKKKRRIYHEAAYKYFFILLNLALITPLLNGKFASTNMVITILVFLMGVIALSRFLLEVMRKFIKEERIQAVGNREIVRLLLVPDRYFLAPILEALSRMMHTDKALPKEFINRYEELFRKQFGMEAKDAGTENYWLCYFKATSGNPYHTGTIKTWLHLYGFARNVSCASYIMAAGLTAWIFFKGDNSLSVRVLLLIATANAWVFFIRYWMLYYMYYSKSIFRIFLTSQSPTDN